jgi:hypothetical protein
MHGNIGGPSYKPPRKTAAHDPRVTRGAAADKTMADMVRKTKAGKGTLTYTPKGKGK